MNRRPRVYGDQEHRCYGDHRGFPDDLTARLIVQVDPRSLIHQLLPWTPDSPPKASGSGDQYVDLPCFDFLQCAQGNPR